jgi:osmoprotectant transport system ATP-binding protein
VSIGNADVRAVSMRSVCKSFGTGVVAVRDLSLDVESGEFVALVGESGSGKTTTLKMINRLVEPDAGLVTIFGHPNNRGDAHELRRYIGYVFQGIGLFPHMTVEENVAVTPRLLRWSERMIRARVKDLLDLVELPFENYASRYPRELSGGQRQRVGFARALAGRPRIVLMDEPFGALDPITRDALARSFRRLHDTLDLTTVMVTHDVNEALLLGDRIGVMRNGELVGLGAPPDLLDASADSYARQLLEMPRRQAERVARKFDAHPIAHG